MLNSTDKILYANRIASKLSQQEVADAVGISRVSYTRYENGSRMPDAIVAVKLAHLFHLTIEDLLVMKVENADLDFEKHLIKDVRRLNDAGRRQLQKQLNYLLSDEDYTQERSKLAI